MKKLRLDPTDAEKVFTAPTFTYEDTRFDYGEQRWITIGRIDTTVVVLVHTETEYETHVISIRKAEKSEQIIYYRNS